MSASLVRRTVIAALLRAAGLRVRHSARTRRLALGSGLLLSLALVSTWNGAQSASDDADASSGRMPLTTPSTPHDADALPRASADTALTGTIFSAKSADARTIIADMRGHQRVYARGDEIPEVGEVVEIHRNYVVLRRNGRLEMLDFRWDAVAVILDRAADPARDAAQEAPPGQYLKDLRESMLTHPELLFELVGAIPVVEGERFSGYRVMKPEDPAFLESLSLKPGDVLTAVNGVPLNTPDYGTQLLGTMSGTGKLTFTVRRGSEILVLNY